MGRAKFASLGSRSGAEQMYGEFDQAVSFAPTEAQLASMQSVLSERVLRRSIMRPFSNSGRLAMLIAI
jgi:hypothetical protein